MIDFDSVSISDLASQFGTPVYVYSKATIEQKIEDLKGLGTIRYAQKALPNLAILSLMKQHGIVVDAVSAGELYRAIHTGYVGNSNPPGVVFTADVLDEDAITLIKDYKVPVNAGSPDMIRQILDAGLNVPIILRINPGFGHGHSRKVNTGGEHSKHGIWHEELPALLSEMKAQELELYGLHMHIGSGTDMAHLLSVAEAMERCVGVYRSIFDTASSLNLISAGGGLPIPYRENGERVDLSAYKEVWSNAIQRIEAILGHSVHFEVEPGRYLVAESGILITKIRAKKVMGSLLYYLVDAGFDALVRPAMYGAYHRISIAPAPGRTLGSIKPAVVAGPLCESGDVFTQEDGGVVTTRDLPEAEIGDYLIIHDTGAYGSSMASQYNSRLLAPEVLIANGKFKLIRRRQELEEVVRLEVNL